MVRFVLHDYNEWSSYTKFSYNKNHIHVVADISWPSGAFGLPKPLTECPNCETDEWEEGWIYQDLEDNPENVDSISRKSEGSHMEFAVLQRGNNVLRFFCMKQNTATHSKPWPKGEMIKFV